MSPFLMIIADAKATFTATVVIAGISVVVGVLLLLIYVFKLFGVIVPKIEATTTAKDAKRAARKAAKKAKKTENNKSNENNSIKNEQQNTYVMPVVKREAVAAPLPVVEQGISGEVVAAITAAIVASEGTSVVVRSIKKKNVACRNPWAQAARIDNTRPF